MSSQRGTNSIMQLSDAAWSPAPTAVTVTVVGDFGEDEIPDSWAVVGPEEELRGHSPEPVQTHRIDGSRLSRARQLNLRPRLSSDVRRAS